MDIFGTQKLEEQIAASKDPNTRKQLEELLEERKNKAHKTLFFVLILLVMFLVYRFIIREIELRSQERMLNQQIEYNEKIKRLKEY